MSKQNSAIITAETLVIVVSSVLLIAGGIIFAVCRILAEICKQLFLKPKSRKALPKMLGILFDTTKKAGKSAYNSCSDYKKHHDYTVQNYLDEAREMLLEKRSEERYYKTLNELKRLLAGTENKLYYNVEKTEFPGEGRIREYVNFFTYDHDTVAVENANAMINEALNNVLGIYRGKSKKLNGTIVLEDYACDMKDISRNLADKLGIDEIRMVIA